MNNRPVTINISGRTIALALFAVFLVALLYVLRDLVLVILVAIVIASAIEPAVKSLTKRRIPRVLAVLLIYVLIAASLAGIFSLFLPAVVGETLDFISQLPAYIDSFEVSNDFPGARFFGFGTEQVSQTLSLREMVSGIEASLSNASEGFVRTLSIVFGGIFSFALIVVFSFYFAVQETGIDDFLRVVTPVKQQEYVLGLWKRSQKKIGLWMQGQLLLSVLIGVLVYLGLTIFGVRFALLLAVLAAVLELIPVFGSILAAIPAIAFAFLDGGTTLALLVVGFYIIVNQFQANLIYPLVVQKVVGVPPLLVILALIIGAELAGFLGILLSVPIAATIQEFVADIQRDRKAEMEKAKGK